MFAGAFNLTPFNRLYIAEVLFSVSFEPIVEMDARLNLDMPFTAAFEILSEVESNVIREIPFAALIESKSEFQPAIGVDIPVAVTFEAKAEFEAQIRYYHTDQVVFTGSFAPGDRIVIDTKNFKITKNGQNILHQMEGDFFTLNYGENKLTYLDNGTVRSVLTRVTHRDKYLY